MRISVKARYGLHALTLMANNNNNNEHTTITNIATTLGISKIYLEQTFSLLKRAGLVLSIKGAQGGYQLSRSSKQITVYDVLSATELSLFEKTESTVAEHDLLLDSTLMEYVFIPLQQNVESMLKNITLYDLANELDKKQNNTDDYMYFI